MGDIKQQYVTHEIATMVRNKGFREQVTGIRFQDDDLHIGSPEFVEIMYNKGIDAIPCPTYGQVVEWLRTIHDVHIIPELALNGMFGKRNKPEQYSGTVYIPRGEGMQQFPLQSCEYYQLMRKAIMTAMNNM